MREFDSIDTFYADNELRRHSGELDFGVWWREKPRTLAATWRVSLIRDTREFYAVSDRGKVILLGQIPAPDDDVPDNDRYPAVYRVGEQILDGWVDHIHTEGLPWVYSRIAAVT